MHTESLYRAVESRDRRFEGRFVLAVKTTGVYCRPGCPAPLPRFENCRFYPCAAAAEQAGFRPCRRCRPETAAGTPAWAGTSAAVSRALRLIEDGFLDKAGVEELAAAVGLGGRHLRRLFEEHLGAAPLAIARTRRVHFARRLLDGTELPMVEVALASGFTSLRSFNQAIRDTFGRPPSVLRGAPSRPAGEVIQLRVPYRPPLEWRPLLLFIGARAASGVEVVDGDLYLRTIEIDGAAGWLQVELKGGENALLLTLPASLSRHALPIAERTRRLFDLGADPLRIATQLARHPRLRPLVRRHPGLRVPGCWDLFELGVRAILGQQVTVKGATTLAGRLVERWGKPISSPRHPELLRLFPSAQVLATARVEEIGLPRARANALRAFSCASACGELDFGAAPDLAAARARLSGIPGFGPWTVEYLAMRGLSDPDALPAGDLAVRKGLSRPGRVMTPREVEAELEPVRPWRAYAAMQIWNGAPVEPKKRRRP